MGFSQLRLITPCDHLSEEARMLAHGANEILENAEVFPDFLSSITDIDILVGTTAKKRSVKADYHSPGTIAEILKSKDNSIKKAAIIFGTEESGLPNEILLECDLASSIPLKNPYPSLNLGQSVMLYAYELSTLIMEVGSKKAEGSESYKKLKVRIEEFLPKINIHDKMPVYHRILERISLLNNDDIKLLHSISSRLTKTIKK